MQVYLISDHKSIRLGEVTGTTGDNTVLSSCYWQDRGSCGSEAGACAAYEALIMRWDNVPTQDQLADT